MSIKNALGEIDSSTRPNAAMADQASAACRGLVDDSERLIATIVGFHLSRRRKIDPLAA